MIYFSVSENMVRIMKKNRLTACAFILLLLLSGCGAKTSSELDKIIESLPAAQIVDGKVNYETSTGAEVSSVPHFSLTGKITSASSKEITIMSDNKEYKFKIDAFTKIFGGKIEQSAEATVTYAGALSDKDLTAVIITMLSGEEDSTISSAVMTQASIIVTTISQTEAIPQISEPQPTDAVISTILTSEASAADMVSNKASATTAIEAVTTKR